MHILNKDSRVLWAAASVAIVLAFTAYGMAGAATSVLINTVAGTEPTDPLLATLDSPGGIALDSSGNLYIADTENHIIRMINTSGVINTVAGNGINAYSGDGGPATSASLYRPEGVSVDSAGNIYIADTKNNVIRIVNTSGIINTLAGTGGVGAFSGDGGAATDAELNDPEGVLADSGGNIYIADTTNAVVRKVDSSGTINTFAGIGGSRGIANDGGPATDALLNSPRGLALNSSGHLYISDYDNESVRVVNSSGIIYTIAGTGDFGYSGDSGPATSALLNSPMGIAIDTLDNFYIADSYNSRIRNTVSATGFIYTMAGTGDDGWSGDGGAASNALLNSPEGVAFNNATGDLYISDTDNHRIRIVNSAGDIFHFAGSGKEGSLGDGGAATSAILYEPNGVAFASDGTYYIADLGAHQVRKVDPVGMITTFAGTGIAGYSGAPGPASDALLNTPAGLALDEANDILYIADSLNHAIRAVDLLTDQISTIAGDGTPNYTGDGGVAISATLDLPRGLALDSSGNLYIADSFNNVVRVIDYSSGVIDRFAGNSFGIGGYSGDGGLALIANLSTPYGVWMDSTDSVLYIADTWNNVIRGVTISNSIIDTVAGTGSRGYSGDGGLPTSALLNLPEAVAVTSGGEILIADTENHAIRYINPFTGLINTIGGNGSPGFSNSQFNRPSGITTAMANTLFISDAGNQRVRSIMISDRAPSAPVLVSPLDNSTGLSNTVTFTWEESTDLDGDTLTYDLYVCDDVNFGGGCTPINVSASSVSKDAMYAGSIPVVFFVGLALAAGSGGLTRRRMLLMLLLAAALALVLSCGGNGGGDDTGGGGGNGGGGNGGSDVIATKSATVGGLIANTIHYWKVDANDGTGNVSTSPVWSFTTQ